MRPIGWRRLLLLPLALAACLAVLLLARALAQARDIDARWRLDSSGQLQLAGSGHATLALSAGRTLETLTPEGGAPLRVDGRRALRSSRWTASDDERALTVRQQAALAEALASPRVRLGFSDRSSAVVSPLPRGLAALGLTFWLLCGLGLALHLVGWVVLLVQPDRRNLLFTVMAQAQAAQLVLCAVDAVPGLGGPMLLGLHEPAWRMGLDVVTAAALVHSTLGYPTPLPGRALGAGLAWAGAAAWCVALAVDALPDAWWWTQALCLASGAAVVALLGWSYRRSPHPFAAILRRFALVTIASLALVTLAVALAERMPADMQALSSALPSIWTVFFASLLLMAPFLARSQHMMREFAMLAGVSTLAASVDLLFVAVFSLSQFASLTTSLFIALGLYSALRQWLVDQMVGARAVTTERLFEHLLRIARKVEQQPERTADWQLELFAAVFQPLVAVHQGGMAEQSRWAEGGAALLVPLASHTDPHCTGRVIALRFAERGKRLFTNEDARLADRIVEQLRRAVAHDHAIEQGRHEERQRIAQDLHDDIGARLLTLMYKSTDKEMEDYLRHTLQDLKTLTRGLAATTHTLSHAAGEWKADIAQRLGETGCRLDWSFTHDEDIELGVVQWSALTRILRELVSNIIAHAGARRTVIRGHLEAGVLSLSVSDDGRGGTPQAWSHGLGLGGIRKRVKMLGGQIEWLANTPTGVRCEVSVPLAATATAEALPD